MRLWAKALILCHRLEDTESVRGPSGVPDKNARAGRRHQSREGQSATKQLRQVARAERTSAREDVVKRRHSVKKDIPRSDPTPSSDLQVHPRPQNPAPTTCRARLVEVEGGAADAAAAARGGAMKPPRTHMTAPSRDATCPEGTRPSTSRASRSLQNSPIYARTCQ